MKEFGEEEVHMAVLVLGC